MSIIAFINIFSCGIIFITSITIFLMGTRVISTRIYALLWFAVFLYVFFYTLNNNTQGILQNSAFSYIDLSQKIHFFIPSFAFIYIIVNKKNTLKLIYLTILLVPVFSLIIDLTIMRQVFIKGYLLFRVIYHLIFWSALLAYYVVKPDGKKAKSKKDLPLVFIIIVAVSPYVFINLIFTIKNKMLLLDTLPISLALASVLTLYLSYKKNMLESDYEYYINLDTLKKTQIYEKKTIIEKLTSSLIHEIKNPVTAIQSFNQQLLDRFSIMQENEVRQFLEITSDELGKIKKLSESFLKTYRKDEKQDVSRIGVHQLLLSLETLLMFDFEKRNIRLVLSEPLKNTTVNFNNYQVRQIFLNLLYNAIEADCTTITVYSDETVGFVNIFIEDNGTGIDFRDKDKIFDAFWTTKNNGTGMGLSVCKEIMNDHMGNIELVGSTRNKTVFKLSFYKGEAKNENTYSG